MIDLASNFRWVLICGLATFLLQGVLVTYLRYQWPRVYEKVGRPTVWISASLAFRRVVWREFRTFPLLWKIMLVANFLCETALIVLIVIGLLGISANLNQVGSG